MTADTVNSTRPAPGRAAAVITTVPVTARTISQTSPPGHGGRRPGSGPAAMTSASASWSGISSLEVGCCDDVNRGRLPPRRIMTAARDLADRFHQRWLTENPFSASMYGIPGYDDLMPDESEGGERAWRAEGKGFLAPGAAVAP